VALLAVHGARLVRADDDGAPGSRLDGLVLAAHRLAFHEPVERVVGQLVVGQPGQLVQQQPADVAVEHHAHDVVQAVRRLEPLPGLGHPAVAARQLADPPQ
jgi:hypothetical protein